MLSIFQTSPSFNDGTAIKEYIRKCFNAVLQKNRLNDCQDSTSALTTNKIYFTEGNQTNFSIDLAIVREKYNGLERLKHFKTGFFINDQWYWNETQNSKDLAVKAKDIKKRGMWEEVRKIYLEKKNMYLSNRDHDHPSFIVYIETINEMHNKLFR